MGPGSGGAGSLCLQGVSPGVRLRLGLCIDEGEKSVDGVTAAAVSQQFGGVFKLRPVGLGFQKSEIACGAAAVWKRGKKRGDGVILQRQEPPLGLRGLPRGLRLNGPALRRLRAFLPLLRLPPGPLPGQRGEYADSSQAEDQQ